MRPKNPPLSVVLPCLNEEETIEVCIKKIQNSFKKLKIEGEIIVADNGSIDNSIKICQKNKVRLVHVKIKGYGSALKSGIEKTKNNFVLIADADDSYDLNDIKKFYIPLKQGYDLVQGCRFKKGGGNIQKKAMPFSHQYIGNPFFSWLLKKFIGSPFNDVNCGMRSFNKKKFNKLFHFSNGMTFAIENLIRFILANAKLKEVPVTLYRDGRVKNKSHLKTINDGIKTLKLLILFIPKKIFSFFSLILIFIAIFKVIQISLFGADMSSQLANIFVFLLLGLQIYLFGIYVSLLRKKINLSNDDNIYEFFNYFTLEKSFLLSLLILISGFFIFIQSTYLYLFKELIFVFLFAISSIIFINSMLISLLELVEDKKI